MIIYLKLYIINIEANIKSEIYSNEFVTDYKINLKFKVACNKSLLLGFYSIEYYVPENTANMLEFDIIYFSLLANLAFAIIYQKFLASIAN